jgi:hypothetical protein
LDSDEDATLLSISEEVDETAVELAQVLPVEVLVKGELEGVDEFVIPRAGRAKLVRFGIVMAFASRRCSRNSDVRQMHGKKLSFC